MDQFFLIFNKGFVIISFQMLIWHGAITLDFKSEIHPLRGNFLYGQARNIIVNSDSDYHTDRIEEQLAYEPAKLSAQPIVIYHPEGTAITPLGFAEFERKQCRVRNCFLTTLERHKKNAQVVFFSPTSLVSLEYRRPRGQLWIMRLLESPENTDSLKAYNGKINYTASYRWDSDIVTPYLRWNASSKDVQNSSFAHLDYAKGNVQIRTFFFSFRILRRNFSGLELIIVDIYGDCGDRRIGKREGARMLKSDYKFYLSFENSNCRDYVTEKFFENALSNDVIPIVMGPSRQFYERIAPPHSFIHVDDFDGPKNLANYLYEIDRNDALFNSYFKWKGMGTLMDSNFWCRLCAIVQHPPPKIYQDIDSWWHKKDDCTSNRLRTV
ncbi:unnamed protein product [Toxocara canis]|uniref:Fucosyltransferase n=1 Tax=Toxocara canis TaxID=6265 RepID=A0A183UC27_TOXCA|nr:unnamed protein product [Toxocara canis]